MNSAFLIPQIFLVGIFILGISLIAVFWKKDKRIVVLGCCLLIFATGIYRSQMFEQPEDTPTYYREHYGANVKSPQYEGNHGIIAQIGGWTKKRLSASIERFLSSPESSLLSAIMLGETEGLSNDLKNKLNISGTRHITAISGMNVIILANMLIGLGLIFGLWRGQAFYFAVAAIIFYIIMVGAPPSAVRAGIMGGIVLLAEKAGRLSQATRLLIIAATLMLAFNPLLLEFDIGFQLSFLATFGIAKLYHFFRGKLSWVPQFFEMRNTTAMTIPAILSTAPIVVYNFGQFSLVAFFTNILIVPVFALTLGLGLFAGILGTFSDLLGQIAFAPVWLFLAYAYTIIDWSARLPFASVEITSFPWYLVVLYFALLWWGMYGIDRKHYRRRTNGRAEKARSRCFPDA